MLLTTMVLACGSKADSANEPTNEPTAEPSEEPTAEPSGEPTAEPTAEPSEEPTAEPSEEPAIQVNGCEGTEHESSILCSSWMYNETQERSSILKDGSAGILVNITSSSVSNENGEDYLIIEANGIPNYQFTFSQEDIDALNNRPNAATDFTSGTTTAQAGITYEFGTDIGYMSSSSCNAEAGFGWWPPGPVCPTNQARAAHFPLSPTPAPEGQKCETGLGALGLFVNGVSIYNWSDGASYNNDGIWMNIAAQYEAYDLGPCKGHAANGDYHHHNLSTCLQAQLEDVGDEHSPVYGFAT